MNNNDADKQYWVKNLSFHSEGNTPIRHHELFASRSILQRKIAHCHKQRCRLFLFQFWSAKRLHFLSSRKSNKLNLPQSVPLEKQQENKINSTSVRFVNSPDADVPILIANILPRWRTPRRVARRCGGGGGGDKKNEKVAYCTYEFLSWRRAAWMLSRPSRGLMLRFDMRWMMPCVRDRNGWRG